MSVKNSTLTRWIVLLPILGVFITAFILIVIGIQLTSNVYKDEINSFKVEATKASKARAVIRVGEVEKSFLINESVLIKSEKEKIKDMVLFAVNLMDVFYRQNSDLKRQDIIKHIKKRLRDIRFFENKTGYFFIYDLKGNCILLPPNPTFEGKNLLNLKDAQGKFTIKEAIKFIKKSHSGYLEWYWYKPNDKNEMKKKIGYLYYYESLGIYIGTARYEEDIVEKVKNEILANLKLNSARGRFFVYDGDGKKLYDNTNTLNKLEVKGIKEVSLEIKDGFFMSKKSVEGFDIENATKIQSYYVKYIPEFDWIIGTNTYDNSLLMDIEEKKKSISSKVYEIVWDMVFVAVIAILVILFLMLALSSKLREVLKSYQKNLIKKNKEMRKQKEKLAHQVAHDILTSLPNRFMLSKKLELAIRQSRSDDKKLALMFLDIDKFKSINDSLGHNIGDIFLQKVAKRIKDSVRDRDLVARFGGDEFVVLIENYNKIHDLIVIVEKIQKALKKPIKIEDTLHQVTLSIGISLYPFDGINAEELLKNADIAMYRAKEEGRDGYRFFTQTMNDEIQNQIEIEKSLHVAIKKKEFVLHYQPLVDVGSEKIFGVEALLRWNHSKKGMIYPDKFISVAEESNLIVPIGEWIIDEAISQLCKWKKSGYSIKKVSVNVALKQLESGSLISCIEKTLRKHNAKPEWLEIEVIERAFMKDFHKVTKVLRHLRQMGIDVAIDDFGTGYSSLAYLKRLPITKLKIDREFVKNILESYEDRAIAKTIVSLGHGLKIDVLAEGVENEKQRKLLVAIGCRKMQGYLFSRPVEAKEIDKLLAKD